MGFYAFHLVPSRKYRRQRRIASCKLQTLGSGSLQYDTTDSVSSILYFQDYIISWSGSHKYLDSFRSTYWPYGGHVLAEWRRASEIEGRRPLLKGLELNHV